MSLNSRILAQYDYTGPMSRSVWSLKLCFLVWTLCILTAPVRAESLWEDIYPFNVGGLSLAPGSQSVNTSEILVEVGTTPFHPLIVKSPETDPSRQLWQARIRIDGDTKHDESKNELRRIIREIGSVEFKPRQQGPEPLIVVEPIRKTDPNENASDKGMPLEDESGKIEHKLPYKRVTDKTLQVLKSLSQHPEQLHNPLELGEILFSSHCLKEAAKCYREALNRMTAGETGQGRDTAWLLFQTGNCLRQDDPATAIQMYGQLIDQYPDSPWASLAKAKRELIGWYLKDAPEKLINEYKLPTL